MEWAKKHQARLILLLLLIGAMSTASIVPYMGVYIVEGLGKDPWMLSIYTALTITLTLVVNRQFGEWIDNGVRISNLVLASIIAFMIANVAIIIVQQYWVLLVVASFCFSISKAATSTLYSYGRLYATQSIVILYPITPRELVKEVSQ